MSKDQHKVFNNFIQKLKSEHIGSTAKKNGRQMIEPVVMQKDRTSPKRRIFESEEKDKCIRELREENLSLHNQIKALTAKSKGEMIKIEDFDRGHLIKEESLSEIDELTIIAETCQRIEQVFNKNFNKELAAIGNISQEFLNLMKRNPDHNQVIHNAVSQLQESIEKMSLTHIQEKVCSGLAKFKDTFKKQREILKASLEEIIETSMKTIQEKQENLITKERQLLNCIPSNIKQLKQASKKRQEEYKRQVKLLQERIISMSEENRQTVDTQNKVIQQLGESLSSLKAIYNREVQIPLVHIRQTIQREIKNIKFDFSKMQQNANLNFMIDDLIQSLKKYAQSKNIANNTEMHEEIKKISDKLTIFNEQSIGTINQVRQIIRSGQRFTTDYGMISKAPAKEEKMSIKKKQIDEFSIELKYQKQKEYIAMLQLYNKKLEQSVMRTQKQNGRVLSEEWKIIQEEYRSKQKDLNTRLATMQRQIKTSKNEITQIKDATLSILQTQKLLAESFQSFEKEIVTIKSFKDELFNFLQNELKFRQEITNQINNFNTFFVNKYVRLSQLQTTLPESEHFQEINQTKSQQLCKMLLINIDNFSQFKEEYKELFISKVNHDYQFYKAFSSIVQIRDQYSKLSKIKPEKLLIQLDFQPLKAYIASTILRIEDLAGNTRSIKDALTKYLNSIRQELQNSSEECRKVMQFVKQSKLLNTLQAAARMVEEKNQILFDMEKILAQFAGARSETPRLFSSKIVYS